MSHEQLLSGNSLFSTACVNVLHLISGWQTVQGCVSKKGSPFKCSITKRQALDNKNQLSSLGSSSTVTHACKHQQKGLLEFMLKDPQKTIKKVGTMWLMRLKNMKAIKYRPYQCNFECSALRFAAYDYKEPAPKTVPTPKNKGPKLSSSSFLGKSKIFHMRKTLRVSFWLILLCTLPCCNTFVTN